MVCFHLISLLIPSHQEAFKGDIMEKINALFVETNGIYYNDTRIIPWSILEDAFNCKNGVPAIAHPPCERWGRYWSGGPSAKSKKLLGDDGCSFAFSLWYVRTFGGVIEHPEASIAWRYFGLKCPPKAGGWVSVDSFGGIGCCVEQGNYGHKARKATWLYVNKLKTKELIWGRANGKQRIDEGFRSKEQAKEARASENFSPVKRLTRSERLGTPIEFKELLISFFD